MTDATRPSIWSHPALLWAAFILVHLALAAGNAWAPGQPLYDVTDVYRSWAEQAVTGGPIVGLTTEWVYPVLALAPMLVALLGGDGYGAAWILLVAVLNAAAFATILGIHRSPRLAAVAWWWLAFLVLLGPIAVGRIDAITVPIALIGALLLLRRPVVATVLFTVAAWIKVWPVALVGALVIARHDRWRIAGVAVATSAVITAAWALGSSGLGGGTSGLGGSTGGSAGTSPAVFSFITEQTTRGLQIEAPISLIWLWQAAAGVQGASVYYDRDILTFQVTGNGVELAAQLITPIMALAVIAVALLGVLATRAGADSRRMLPSLMLGLVVVLIAFNKVGSPQFVAWLAVPIVFALVSRVRGSGGSFGVPAALTLLIALLTQLVYPFFYDGVVRAEPLMLTVLTARNLLYFVLLGWAVRDLWNLGRPHGRLEAHHVKE